MLNYQQEPQTIAPTRRQPISEGITKDPATINPSDETSMLDFGNGDASAFDRLYAKHKGPLFRYVSRYCHNQAIAEELFQDIWLKVIGARQRYQPTAKFTTWLYHLAHNQLIDHYRKQQRTPTAGGLTLDDEKSAPANHDVIAALADPNHISADQQLDSQRQYARLLTLISTLPDAQREVFLLREEAALSLQEIATVTSTGIETAKSRLRYAVAALRRGLRGEQ